MLLAVAGGVTAAPALEPVPILDARLRQNYFDNNTSASEAPGSLRFRAGMDVLPWDTTLQLRFQWQAEGIWDGEKEGEGSYEALSESWINLADIAYLPLSLKVGRQFITDQQPLLFGGRQDADWLFDGGLFKVDLADRDWSLFAASPAHVAPDTPWSGVASLYTHREWGRRLESSLGVTGLEGEGEAWATLFSAQAQVHVASAMELYVFSAVQGGELESGPHQAAWLLDLGAQKCFTKSFMQPGWVVQYTEASGDSDEDQSRAFRPLFNEEIFGRILSPRLSNVGITRAGLTLVPMDHISAGLDVRYYRQNKTSAAVVGQEQFQESGLLVPTSGASADLGWECTAHAEWTANEFMKTRAYASAFFHGDAYNEANVDSTTYEVRVSVLITY